MEHSVVSAGLQGFLGWAGCSGLALRALTRRVIRAVVDTSVLVSAFVGDPMAGPGRLVEAWRDQRFVLVVSPGLFAELDDVLAGPKLETMGRRRQRAGIRGRVQGALVAVVDRAAAPPRYTSFCIASGDER